MGSAVWEFMWCLDKITKVEKGVGWVLGGKPINLIDLSGLMGTSDDTASRNLARLVQQGYIDVTRTPYGLKIKVMKAKKRFKNLESMTSEEYFEWQKKKMSDDRKGDKHYNWKGGITPENHSARNSLEYKEWRLAVFERDQFTCQECKKIGGKLEAHHIEHFATNIDLRFDVTNGKTLCIDCHNKVHRDTAEMSNVIQTADLSNPSAKMRNVIKTVSEDSIKEDIVAKSDEEFSFDSELEILKNGGKNGTRNDFKVIALYWKRKGWTFKNKKQFNAALGRELRAAKALTGYTGKEVGIAINFCKEKFPEMWTLETVHKRITDLTNK